MRVLFVLFLLCMMILSCDETTNNTDSDINTYNYVVCATYDNLYISYYTNTDYALCSTDNYVVCYRGNTQYIIPFTSVVYIKRLKKK